MILQKGKAWDNEKSYQQNGKIWKIMVEIGKLLLFLPFEF